jgi:hypothetical protein
MKMEQENSVVSDEVSLRVLRRLERKGVIVSKVCDDGEVRWSATEKPYCEDDHQSDTLN